MNNKLAQKFTFKNLILFTIPNIVMMFFLSLYTIADGIFVSRIIGTTALSSVNMIYPSINLQMSIAIMLATGGSAVIATKMGRGENEDAKQIFSAVILIEFLLGVLVLIIGNIFIEDIVRFLGASPLQFEMSKTYGRILFSFAPFFFLQTAFQVLFVTAGKPVLGLVTTTVGGVLNIVLDYYLLSVLKFGIEGAAIATGAGYMIPSLTGAVYFFTRKNESLHFIKPQFDFSWMKKTLANGSSEMVTNLSNAITTFLFNLLFLKYYGEDGVASITIVMYFEFVFTSIFIGFSLGVGPIISYQYGYKDFKQLKMTIRRSIIFIGITCVLAMIIPRITIDFVASIFTDEGSNVYSITTGGMSIFATAYLFMGFNILASGVFTALSDGLTSAIISFARTLVFLVTALLILPLIFGKLGLWIAVPVAEALGILVSIFYFLKFMKKYWY